MFVNGEAVLQVLTECGFSADVIVVRADQRRRHLAARCGFERLHKRCVCVALPRQKVKNSLCIHGPRQKFDCDDDGIGALKITAKGGCHWRERRRHFCLWHRYIPNYFCGVGFGENSWHRCQKRRKWAFDHHGFWCSKRHPPGSGPSSNDDPGIGIYSISRSGNAVTINSLSTSSVNAPYAIANLKGDAGATISGGALVTGAIFLTDGSDTLTIGSGTTLSGVAIMSGGTGTDTLNISSGWSGVLDDWEVINADTSNGDFALDGFTLGNRSFGKLGAGALTLDSGSTLSMGVPQGWADPLILATGEATVVGDLVVTPGQTLTFGQEYRLIEASALTGTFGDVSISGGYKTTLRYTGTSVLLRFDPDSLLALGGDSLSPNARAVAAAFDAAVDGGFDPQAFANL